MRDHPFPIELTAFERFPVDVRRRRDSIAFCKEVARRIM